MNKGLLSTAGVGMATALFFAGNLFSGSVLGNARMDLTEENLFTLSEGARNIASGLEEPVQLYLYFSEDAVAEESPQHLDGGRRVQSLLEEFARVADGKINLEVIDPEPLPAYRGDAEVADHLRWVANFVREHSAMTFQKTSPEMAKKLGWVSIEPNEFTAPGQWATAAGEQAYGNTHAWYASAPYSLEPDEALLIKGRFPDCRFANVVLWNAFMQSYDYMNRQVSLNRNQVEYEDDGSFRLVVAHDDPGVPNWLDTEGRRTGTIYWRYIFPTETPERVVAKVVKRSSLS